MACDALWVHSIKPYTYSLGEPNVWLLASVTAMVIRSASVTALLHTCIQIAFFLLRQHDSSYSEQDSHSAHKEVVTFSFNSSNSVAYGISGH